MKQPEGLIKVLLDSTASSAERDDVAMDLGHYDGLKVIKALFEVADNNLVDATVRASCGESLASIWLRADKLDVDLLAKLNGEARQEAISLIRTQKPEWLKSI